MNCGPYWYWSVIKQAVARGLHCSSLDPDHAATVEEDIRYQEEAEFSQIVPWEEVNKLMQKNEGVIDSVNSKEE